MSLTYAIANSLSFAFGKFLLKKYLNDDGVNTVADVLTDIAKPRIKDKLDQKKAARAIEELADKIVAQIEHLLKEEQQQHPGLNVEGIAEQLLTTLQADLSAEFFLKGDLDSRRVADNYAARRPLPRNALDPRSGEAYGRMLDHAAQCLVALANQLPDFQSSAIAEGLQRLRNLDETADKTLRLMRQMVTEVERLAAPGDPQKFELQYRQAVAANLDYIELFGITVPRELKRFQLLEAFVSLNLQRSKVLQKGGARKEKSESDKGDSSTSAGESELLSCEATFERLRPGEGRLLIRGAAGSGKTTLMRWAAIQAAGIVHPTLQKLQARNSYFGNLISDARAAHIPVSRLVEDETTSFLEFIATMGVTPSGEPNPRPWREQVPFVVLLRHCPGGELPLANKFHELIGEGVGQPPADWVHTILREGRGLVLIDGVDEVPPDQRGVVIKRIEQLTTHYPDSYFVVTTRPIDFHLRELGFREAHVDPMATPDVEHFIRRWHEVAQRNLAAAGQNRDLTDRRQHLLEQLEDNDALRPLAMNPLLCAMICALHLDRSGTLPESQSALCDALCDLLLHEREREQKLLDKQPFPPAYADLSVDQKRTLVQDLAVYMIEEGRSALPQTLARERVARRLAGFKARSAADAEIVLEGLLERSGILREPVPDEVDFLHNTFKEFLAGEYFASDRATNKLLEHVFAQSDKAETWRRVTLFAAGSRRASEDFACNLIQQLLTAPKIASAPDEADAKKKRRSKKSVMSAPERLRHLLALQCQIVADGRGLSPDLKIQLADLVKQLFPPRTLSDAESLATLRDQAVPYLERSRNGKQTKEAALHCVRALRLINTSRARKALADYFDMGDNDILVELAQVINPLLVPAIVRTLQDHDASFLLLHGIRERITDLSPLRECTDIKELYLHGLPLSDISPLKDMTALTKLVLSGKQVLNNFVQKMPTAFKWVATIHMEVSDISALKGLIALTQLDLSYTRISDISALKGLINLRQLNLAGTQVSDVTPLKELTALRELNLSETPVIDISALKGIPGLMIKQ